MDVGKTGRTTQQLLGLLIVCVVDLTDKYATVAARSDRGFEKPSDRRLACDGESAHPERTIKGVVLDSDRTAMPAGKRPKQMHSIVSY